MARLLSSLLPLIIAITVSVTPMSGQGPTSTVTPTPAFEVASVKRNLDPQLVRFSILPRGRLIVTGVDLRSLILQAFGLPAARLLGVSDWARSERFDITAKAPEGAASGTRQLLLMLQQLLTTRFALKAHRETRDLPIYVLTRARPDGPLGAQLQRSDIDCGGFIPGLSEVPEQNAGPRCAITGRGSADSAMVAYRLRGRSMAQLASDLQVFMDRPVHDQTNLDGLFDVTIEFSTGAASDGVSLFTAIQEQLGLKLESARARVEVLAIDSVQRPKPD